MKQYLAIDIGGTAVKLGIVDEEGRVLSKTEQSVCFDGYQTPILTTVLKAAKEFLAAQNIPAESLTGIGVSATGRSTAARASWPGPAAACPTTSEAPLKQSWKRSSACRPLSPTMPTA
mgnify:CR=1 FL=1